MKVRNEHGYMIATVDGNVAREFLTQPGHWEEKKYDDGTKRNCYIFDTDFTYGCRGLFLCVYKGAYLHS